jgi:hypothetical protein
VFRATLFAAETVEFGGGGFMNLKIGVIGRAKVLMTLCLALVPALVGCPGKSEGGGEDGDAGKGGAGNGGTTGNGGTSARGGSSATGGGGTSGGATNGAVIRVTQGGVSKIDLLFMIDNSISMGDKQRVLSEAVPVLVQRLIDPICVDENGDPVGGTTAGGCDPNRPEFTPIKDIHIGIVTSSLGNHGGDVCVTDPAEMPPRPLNDAAQLLPSVRPTPALYSYANSGFLVWDPRMGMEIPTPDPHPGKGPNETVPNDFVTDFAAHLQAAGERGCGYESSLEAWYRFLVDPEPISEVTNDGRFSVRGPINSVVLAQRAAFLRPDSLLAIVMLTDENDCSINDENGQQGWMVGTRNPMTRATSECSHPEDPDLYRCCRPCLLEELAGCPNASADPECALGTSLMPLEDSFNLRCFDQVRRFGVNFLYPWQRYVDGLTSSRFALRAPGPNGETEVQNPIYRAGADGTPPRDQEQVFLIGIVGVPWQDLATATTLNGRALRYLTSEELAASNRWDVILGDPDIGVRPTDPFMIESNQENRAGANPITNDAITPSSSTSRNAINGHEQNIVNRDDLQYACVFDLVPDVPCTASNQDGCDCNASEQAYNRPTCQHPGAGLDGTQTHAKAYPGVRHLQVLKGLGDKAVVASICPKNVEPMGGPASDPDYGYNPAVGAMIGRFTRALGTRCLPRPIDTNFTDQIPCHLVETRLPSSGASCSCQTPGHIDLTPADASVRRFVEDELVAGGYCGGATGVACSDYCLCEIAQLSGDEVTVCQNFVADPGTIYGFCYVDPDNGLGTPELVADCPETERQLIRFVGPDVPAPGATTFLVCTDL